MTINEKQEKIHVIIDVHESDEIKKYLTRYQTKNFSFEIKGIAEGDFLTDRVIIERKKIKDLQASLFDGRYTGQTNKMATHSDKIRVFLIIGNLKDEVQNMRRYKINANELTLINAIASASYRYGFYVIWAHDYKEGLRVMLSFIQGIHNEKFCEPVNAFPSVLMARYLGISKQTMEKLLRDHSSLKNIAELPEAQLIKYDGIGKIRAKQIKYRLTDTVPIGKHW